MEVEVGRESGERKLVYLPGVVVVGIEGGNSANLLHRLR